MGPNFIIFWLLRHALFGSSKETNWFFFLHWKNTHVLLSLRSEIAKNAKIVFVFSCICTDEQNGQLLDYFWMCQVREDGSANNIVALPHEYFSSIIRVNNLPTRNDCQCSISCKSPYNASPNSFCSYRWDPENMKHVTVKPYRCRVYRLQVQNNYCSFFWRFSFLVLTFECIDNT